MAGGVRRGARPEDKANKIKKTVPDSTRSGMTGGAGILHPPPKARGGGQNCRRRRGLPRDSPSGKTPKNPVNIFANKACNPPTGIYTSDRLLEPDDGVRAEGGRSRPDWGAVFFDILGTGFRSKNPGTRSRKGSADPGALVSRQRRARSGAPYLGRLAVKGGESK
jgi:hypothetical protein